MQIADALAHISFERLRERGLIGFSGFMAAACALTALLSTLVVLLAIVITFIVPALPLPDGSWSLAHFSAHCTGNPCTGPGSASRTT